jgi:hypothetical protein
MQQALLKTLLYEFPRLNTETTSPDSTLTHLSKAAPIQKVLEAFLVGQH